MITFVMVKAKSSALSKENLGLQLKKAFTVDFSERDAFRKTDQKIGQYRGREKMVS